MNYFVIIVNVFLLVWSSVFSNPVNNAAIQKAAEKLMTTCKSKVGATDSDLEILKNHKLPETHTGLCLMECVFNTTKLMKDGKYSKSGFIDGFKPLTRHNPEMQKNVEQLAEICETKIDKNEKDKCEVAHLLVLCIVNNGNSYGLNIPGTR